MEKAGRWSGISGRILFLLCIPLFISCINYKTEGDHFTFCLFKNITGMNCYGCGLLRGISALLHLDFKSVYDLNRLNIITIPLLLFIYGREWLKIPGKILSPAVPASTV